MGTEINGATGNSLAEIRERHTNAAKESQPTGIHTSGNYWDNKQKNYTEEQTEAVTEKLQETVARIEDKNIFKTDENEDGFLSTNIQVLADDEDAIRDVRTLFTDSINYVGDQKSGVKATILNPKSKEENELATKINTIALAMWEVKNPEKDPLIDSVKKQATSYLKAVYPGYFDNPALDTKEVKSVIAMLNAKSDEDEMMGALNLMGAVDFNDIGAKSLKIKEGEDGSTSIKAASSNNLWGRMFKKLGKNPISNALISRANGVLNKIAFGPLNRDQMNLLSKNNALRNNLDRFQKVYIKKADQDSQKMVVKATTDEINNTLPSDFETISSTYNLGLSKTGLIASVGKGIQSLMKMVRPNGIEQNTKLAFEGNDSYFSNIRDISSKRAKVNAFVDTLKELDVRLNSFDPSGGVVSKMIPLSVIGNTGQDGKLLARKFLNKAVNNRLDAIQGLLDKDNKITNAKDTLFSATNTNITTSLASRAEGSTISDADMRNLQTLIPNSNNVNAISISRAGSMVESSVKQQIQAASPDLKFNFQSIGSASLTGVSSYLELNGQGALSPTNGAQLANNQLVDRTGNPIEFNFTYKQPNGDPKTFKTTYQGIIALTQLDDIVTKAQSDLSKNADFLNAVVDGAPPFIADLEGLLQNRSNGYTDFTDTTTYNDQEIDSILQAVQKAGLDTQEISFDPKDSTDISDVKQLTEKIIPEATSALEQVSEALTSIKKKFFTNIQKFASKHLKIANTSKAVVSQSLIDRENGDLMIDTKIANQLLKSSAFDDLVNEANLAGSRLKANQFENQAKIISESDKLVNTNNTGGNSIINLTGSAFRGKSIADVDDIVKDITQSLEKYRGQSQSITTFLNLEKGDNGLLQAETYKDSNNQNNLKVKEARFNLLKAKLVELSHGLSLEFKERVNDANGITTTLNNDILGTNAVNITKFENGGTASANDYENFTKTVSDADFAFDIPEADKSAQSSIDKIKSAVSISSLDSLNDEWKDKAVTALVGGFQELMQSTGLTADSVKEIFAKNEELEGEIPSGFQGLFFDALKDSLASRKGLKNA